MKRFLSGVILAPIRAYQRFISPAMPRRCKYYPTCSAYAIDAVREFGVLRGLVLAGWRLLRCNPFSHGGSSECAPRHNTERRSPGLANAAALIVRLSALRW